MSLPRDTAAYSSVLRAEHPTQAGVQHIATGRSIKVGEWTHAHITNHLLPTLSKLSSASCHTNVSLLPASEYTWFASWLYSVSALGSQKARKPSPSSVTLLVFITCG